MSSRKPRLERLVMLRNAQHVASVSLLHKARLDEDEAAETLTHQAAAVRHAVAQQSEAIYRSDHADRLFYAGLEAVERLRTETAGREFSETQLTRGTAQQNEWQARQALRQCEALVEAAARDRVKDLARVEQKSLDESARWLRTGGRSTKKSLMSVPPLW